MKLSEEFLNEFRNTDCMRFKWLGNGCRNWDELIKALEERIEVIQVLKAEGYVLTDNNDDDWLFYQKPKTGKELKEETFQELRHSVLDMCKRKELVPEEAAFEVIVTGFMETSGDDEEVDDYSRKYEVTGIEELMESMEREHERIKQDIIDVDGEIDFAEINVINPLTNYAVFTVEVLGLLENGNLQVALWGNFFEKIEFELESINAEKELGGFEEEEHDERELKLYEEWTKADRNLQAVPQKLIDDFLEAKAELERRL